MNNAGAQDAGDRYLQKRRISGRKVDNRTSEGVSMKFQMVLGILSGCALLSGCVTVDPVYLKDANGRTAQCGPYTELANIPMETEAAEVKMRTCVSGFERQGYERVNAPG